jgi:hypothetical protein
MARIDDGHPTTITFGNNPSGSGAEVTFWEKSITPPGADGGGENDTTTMRNSTYRTKAPKALISLTDCKATVSYDAAIYDDIIAMLNVITTITIEFPDTSTLLFYGWLDKFEPGDISEGSQPTADITIVASNQDSNGTEQPPVYEA